MSIESSGAVGDLRLLAEGPTAKVYAGRLVDDGRAVAIKMFADGFDADTTAWLDRERKALDALREVRPILPVDAVIKHRDGRSGVRMELCRGSVAGLFDSGVALSLRDVLAIGSAIATALAAAHRAGILHGGVTPHNVLYRRSGEFVLADFGLALRRRFPRDPMHAVAYTAPETLREDTISAASDLYGLGAILHTALTGAPPFPHRTGQQPGERILQVLREPVPPIRASGVPAELSDVVGRLLAKDPADRPQDAAMLMTLFARIQRATGSGAIEPGNDSGEADDEDDEPAAEFDDFAEVAQHHPPTAGHAPPVAAGHAPPPVSGHVPPVTAGHAPPVAEPATPGRTLVHTFGGESKPGKRPHNRRRTGILIGVGVGVLGLTAVPLFVGSGEPAEQAESAPTAVAAPPPQQPADPKPDVNLEVAPPEDRGDQVQLTWRADGDLDFGVVVAGERIDTMVLAANRDRTKVVPVDPTRRYCFQVRATDGKHIYTSDPIPIRGTRCNL
ncbi:protein kinase [Saccharopolyspora shandongensis]|uniref:serine/threonine protein kinase n=1 Tax=Saccharopolyspora shandongensis TaxID=418495 RepID=UPI003424F619